MSNILLTGGRAPATLELARAFHRAGHTVFMAESLRWHLSQPSKAVAQSFLVPAPRQHFGAYVEALKTVILENKIDLLIPTCDETFAIGMAREEFACAVFAEPIKKLNIVYNKWFFLVTAIEFELFAPETMLIANQDDLLHAFAQWREIVLKPVYPRAASGTLIMPTIKQAVISFGHEPQDNWIAQELVHGQQFGTYSVCHNGYISAHTTYPADFTTGQGATNVFHHVEHPAIFSWVKNYVENNRFTGQIAFDFIQAADGRLFVLECRPHATSGVHLLASNPKFVESFFQPQEECLKPLDLSSHMLATGMLVRGLPAALKNKEVGKWLAAYFNSDDVVLDYQDPLPFLLQFRSFFSYVTIAWKSKISLREAYTYDIEWDGGGL